jgi:phage terminase Nu1 subunit (DNA packaging protein)
MVGFSTPIPHLSGLKVSKAELSEIFGESIATLDHWVRSGCPCERTGSVRSPLKFDTAQVHAWRSIWGVQNQAGPAAARALRLEFERDALATALARKRD